MVAKGYTVTETDAQNSQNSNSNGTPVIIGATVGLVGAFVIFLIVWHKFVHKMPFNPPFVRNSQHANELEAERTKALEEGYRQRIEEESQMGNGEPVWFSRHEEHGALRHWVLYAYGTKYELRRDLAKQTPENPVDKNSRAPRYNVSISEKFLEDLFRIRREAFKAGKLPVVSGFYICLIGWTTLSKQELDQEFKQCSRTFGSYNILFNNCQHILKTFSDRVLIPQKAADYGWFRENLKNKYKSMSELPPYDEILKVQKGYARMSMMNINNITTY